MVKMAITERIPHEVDLVPFTDNFLDSAQKSNILKQRIFCLFELA